MAKIIRATSYREGILRSVCRKVFHGHAKKRKGVVVCILPRRTFGPQMLARFIGMVAKDKSPWYVRKAARRA